jgi:hypothetical protein
MPFYLKLKFAIPRNLTSVHPEIPDVHTCSFQIGNEEFCSRSRKPGTRCKAVGTEHPKRCKEIKGLCGDVLEYVAQTRPPIDAEIGQKDHFRMETNEMPGSRVVKDQDRCTP